MMKKLIVFVLAVCMMMSCAFAGEEVKGTFSGDELTGYVGNVLDMFMNSDNVNVEDVEGKPCYTLQDASVLLLLEEGEELASDANVYQIVMSDLPDIREIRRGDSVSKVLEKYPNDNESPKGTEYAALLYMEGDLTFDGTVKTGYIARDNGRITDVCYMEMIAAGEDMPVIVRAVTYEVIHDVVTSIVYCDTTYDLTEVQMLIDELTDAQENGLYIPAIDPGYEGEAEVFGREDLYFSGLDLVTLTDEEAVAQYGVPSVDEMIEDSEAGEKLRVCEWNETIQIIFVYDLEGNFIRTHSVRIYGADFAGPRGVLVGDALINTMARFYYEEETGLLYGNGHDLPWGQIQTTDTAVTLVYACDVEGRMAVFHMTFCNDVLSEMLVTLE